MNIFFLDSIEKEIFGGYQNWIRLISAALAGRRFNVTVAGRPGSEFLRRIKDEGGEVQRLELDISGDFNPFTILKIKKYFYEKQIDVVICDFNKDVRLGGIAARLNGKTKVLWRLGLDMTKDNFIHRFLTPKLIDAAVVPSERLKQQVLKFGYINPDGISIIPHGIPEKNFPRPNSEANQRLKEKYGINENNIIAVTSGRFVNQKGHIYLIDAAVNIIREFPSITFLLLGKGPLENLIKDKIKTNNLTEYFIFAGMLDDFDIELGGADIMLHSAVEEPFGFVIIEGMRAGLPIVATRVGGVPEIVIENETALLVEPCNSDSLSRTALELLKSPEKMHLFGLAGQKRWRSNYSLGIMTDRWEKYLNEFIKDNPDYTGKINVA